MKYWFGYLTAGIFAAITWVLLQFGKKFTTLVDMFSVIRHGKSPLSMHTVDLLYTGTGSRASPPGGYSERNKNFDR